MLLSLLDKESFPINEINAKAILSNFYNLFRENPYFIRNIIVNLPEDKITDSLENRLVRILRTVYSPKFNDNPEHTLSEIENKINQVDGKRKEIYQKLYQHYQDILKIKEELKN